jgi:hypothetical protein
MRPLVHLYPAAPWAREHTDYSLPGLTGEYDASSFNRAWMQRLRVFLGLAPRRQGPPAHPAPADPMAEPTMKALLTKYKDRPQWCANWRSTYEDIRVHKPEAMSAWLVEERWQHLREERRTMDPVPHYTRPAS